MDVLPLQLAVFVHNVVKGVDIHVRAETKQKVAHHFVDPDRPLHRGKTVSVDGVPDVKMKEIEFLLHFVERRLDECGVGKREVSGKGSVVCDEKIQRLPNDQSFGDIFHLPTSGIKIIQIL